MLRTIVPPQVANTDNNHHKVVDLSDRALQQIETLQHHSGRCWWNDILLQVNLLRGASNLAMLDARSQAEASFRAVLKLSPEDPTALTGPCRHLHLRHVVVLAQIWHKSLLCLSLPTVRMQEPAFNALHPPFFMIARGTRVLANASPLVVLTCAGVEFYQGSRKSLWMTIVLLLPKSVRRLARLHCPSVLARAQNMATERHCHHLLTACHQTS